MIADRPVTFTVQKENFAIPVDPYDVKGIEVGEAKAEFGTVTLENSGLLQALLALLRSSFGNQLTATITPVLAQVKNGIATYERTDIILDNRISVATWGNIDLAQDVHSCSESSIHLPVRKSLPSDTGPKRTRISRLTFTPCDSHKRRTSRFRPSRNTT